ncbi:Stf0 family sulfotransferase [Roseibium algae]|uniref:Stf0 family sulfotransferase n=1 Tax=Roseibium algae TaxID=3123038 RepID=A0ABU8TI16_9HYPH
MISERPIAEFESYVICTSPRSGSTLLCKLLAATGVSGAPRSYFHEPSLSSWLKYFGLEAGSMETEAESLARVLRAAHERGTNGTGVFGLRLQRHSVDFFLQKLKALHPGKNSDLDRIQETFGRTLFIYLTRPDKVQQAVSYVKTEQSGLWHKSSDGTELERLSPPREPFYDGSKIKACYDQFSSYERDWTTWFGRQGIEPHRIAYNTLSAAPSGTLRDVLVRLGLSGEAANGIKPPVAKLADETSAVWVERFRHKNQIA